MSYLAALALAALNAAALAAAAPLRAPPRAAAPSAHAAAQAAQRTPDGQPDPGAPAAGARPAAAPTAPAEPPHATRELLRAITPPPRDEADLVRRFKHACGAPAARGVPLYRDEAVGEARTFWVLDEPNRRYFEAAATLRYASEHLLFYVQTTPDRVEVSHDALAASAAVFEQRTYPVLRQYFGDLPVEPRITVFNGRVPGVAGYFSASDLWPRAVNPFSNERVLVFMSTNATRPGTAGYDAVLAHEAQHFVHWIVKPQQDSWINEGASELATALAGHPHGGYAQSFLAQPETQLNAWKPRPAEAVPHYGGAYLMLEYFAQRMGGYDRIKRLLAAPGVSTATFDNYFREQGGPLPPDREEPGRPLRFDDLFRDFVLATLLNDRTLADGRFGLDRHAGQARVQESQAALPATSAGAIRPYATRYVELLPESQRGDLALRFEGAAAARLYGGAPRSGRAQWWGNAADEMESTLTREFDLTGVRQATLQFAAWFHTEPDYDYAGVALSTDGGCSWRTLPGRHTTDTNPTGQNLGHSFNGASGGGEVPAWVDEAMDLTPYAGQKVLIRFFYVTDQSYHGSGVALDDVAIPEIGFYDDAEADRGWQAAGFLRSVNAAALEWAVQVVAFGDGGPQIMQLTPAPGTGPAGGPAAGTLTVPRFGERVTRVVVAISPLVPVTLEPVDYRLDARLN